MWTFRTGDLLAKTHPAIKRPLQIGLVISHDVKTFTIKWVSYNKVFFMEKEEDIFGELNKSLLLDTVQVYRGNGEINLSLLNSSYSDDKENQKTTQHP